MRLIGPLEISDVRQTYHGPGDYIVCLREATRTPGYSPICHSVFFDNDTYKGDRQSVIMDECELQTYRPLPSVEPVLPSAPEPKSAEKKRDTKKLQDR
jgi:hypothetical protein